MTITHEVDREEVMAYLDGELAAARAVDVRAHLDQCAECRALADELREVSAEPSGVDGRRRRRTRSSRRPAPCGPLGFGLMGY